MCAKVDDFWQVSAAKVWQINFAMRDRLESEHVFFPRSLRFFNLVYPPFSPHFFSLPFFAHARQRLPMFFSSLASGHTIPAYYTTPFPSLNRADRGGSENFLAGKKSSHSNARWKFGSEFFCTKLRCNEQLGCTR